MKYKNKKKLILTIRDALRHHEEVEGGVDRGEDGVVWREPNAFRLHVRPHLVSEGAVKTVKRGLGGDIFEEDDEKGLPLMLLM